MANSTKEDLADAKEAMKVEMFRAMVELLGRGYVPDYYEQSARDFVQIAEQYGIAVQHAGKQHRPPKPSSGQR